MTVQQYADALLGRGLDPEVVVDFMEKLASVAQLAHMMGVPAPDTRAEWDAVFAAYQHAQVITAQASRLTH
jgi:cytochrome P450